MLVKRQLKTRVNERKRNIKQHSHLPVISQRIMDCNRTMKWDDIKILDYEIILKD